MSKKKIIVGILGTTALATGDGAISTVVKTISEKEEKLEEKNDESKKTKENKSKIRRKRENEQHVTFLKNLNSINNSDNFVEKIYNKTDDCNLSLFLNKKIALNLIKLFVETHKLDISAIWEEESKSEWKSKFILETKKIITDIKNNSINLSAKDFDDNAIDAFAYQIWKNFPNFSDFFVDLGMNQKIQITSNITGGYWGRFKFQIIGEKTEWEKDEKFFQKIKPYSNDNYTYGMIDYVTKIYKNETNKKIEVKYQKNGNIFFIFSNELLRKYEILINDKKNMKDINQFKNWLIIEIRNYIIDNNFFLNKLVPSHSEIEQIANVLFKNLDNHNYFLKLNNTNKKIIIVINPNNKSELFFNKDDYHSKSFVEKIYNKTDDCNLSLFLKRDMLFNIIKLFINNNKDDFILETKKIITDIKNNSINLSAKDFDDNAIDAFAHQIWKNFPIFYDLFSSVGVNQTFNIRLDIKSNKWINEKFQVIGGENNWKKDEKFFQKIKPYHNKKCENKDHFLNKNDLVEHSTTSKIKIKINHQIWCNQILKLFFLLKNKNDFIENLTKIFKTFPPSYDDTYKLNKEELKSFAYLIWKNFSYYNNILLYLKNDESIRITSYTNYSEGYWTEEDFTSYNEIVDKNNDVIDWGTFSNRKATEEDKSWLKFDVELRKKRINDFCNVSCIQSRSEINDQIENEEVNVHNAENQIILQQIVNLNLPYPSMINNENFEFSYSLEREMPLRIQIQGQRETCFINTLQNILNHIGRRQYQNLSITQLIQKIKEIDESIIVNNRSCFHNACHNSGEEDFECAGANLEVLQSARNLQRFNNMFTDNVLMDPLARNRGIMRYVPVHPQEILNKIYEKVKNKTELLFLTKKAILFLIYHSLVLRTPIMTELIFPATEPNPELIHPRHNEIPLNLIAHANIITGAQINQINSNEDINYLYMRDSNPNFIRSFFNYREYVNPNFPDYLRIDFNDFIRSIFYVNIDDAFLEDENYLDINGSIFVDGLAWEYLLEYLESSNDMYQTLGDYYTYLKNFNPLFGN